MCLLLSAFFGDTMLAAALDGVPYWNLQNSCLAGIEQHLTLSVLSIDRRRESRYWGSESQQAARTTFLEKASQKPAGAYCQA